MWKVLAILAVLLAPALQAAPLLPARDIDVQHYTLVLHPNPLALTLSGTVEIRFRYGKPGGALTFQLDSLLELTDTYLSDAWLKGVVRQGRNIQLQYDEDFQPGRVGRVLFSYKGKPREAPKPPWQGGLVWQRSAGGKPWVGVACQEDGASLWWPCKDDLADEPDSGASIYCDAPLGLKAVCNGRLAEPPRMTDDRTAQVWHWEVSYPINTYNITFNIGDYVCLEEQLPTSGGSFAARVWLLRQDSAIGYPYLIPRLRQMMEAYQSLFGPYPWPRDGYQLIETSYWGMEHQSAVAYGNKFKPDPFGLDFILIHESGHEWWGNQISVADNADLWVHEGFCTYGEALLCERLYGKVAMDQYLAIQRSKMQNLSALQGPRGIRYHGWEDADIYYRGSALVHTLRLMTGDSTRFIHCLQDILASHRNKSATTESVLQIIGRDLGADKAAFLEYALNQSHPPEIEVYETAKGYAYRLPCPYCPTLRLPDGRRLDNTWRTTAKPIVLPRDWCMNIKKVQLKGK